MAISDLGAVCNIRDADLNNDTTEDTIVYSLILQVMDHVSLSNGEILLLLLFIIAPIFEQKLQ